MDEKIKAALQEMVKEVTDVVDDVANNQTQLLLTMYRDQPYMQISAMTYMAMAMIRNTAAVIQLTGIESGQKPLPDSAVAVFLETAEKSFRTGLDISEEEEG